MLDLATSGKVLCSKLLASLLTDYTVTFFSLATTTFNYSHYV